MEKNRCQKEEIGGINSFFGVSIDLRTLCCENTMRTPPGNCSFALVNLPCLKPHYTIGLNAIPKKVSYHNIHVFNI